MGELRGFGDFGIGGFKVVIIRGFLVREMSLV
jgi:hypothetical protein